MVTGVSHIHFLLSISSTLLLVAQSLGIWGVRSSPIPTPGGPERSWLRTTLKQSNFLVLRKLSQLWDRRSLSRKKITGVVICVRVWVYPACWCHAFLGHCLMLNNDCWVLLTLLVGSGWEMSGMRKLLAIFIHCTACRGKSRDSLYPHHMPYVVHTVLLKCLIWNLGDWVLGMH